jgi:hypothetical protein
MGARVGARVGAREGAREGSAWLRAAGRTHSHARGAEERRRCSVATAPLPAPVLPEAADVSLGPSMCAHGKALGPYVLESRGFELTDEGASLPALSQRSNPPRVGPAAALANGRVPRPAMTPWHPAPALLSGRGKFGLVGRRPDAYVS